MLSWPAIPATGRSASSPHRSLTSLLIFKISEIQFHGIPLPPLYLACGVDACKQEPSAEAKARSQCTTPTDLNVSRTDFKMGETSGCYMYRPTSNDLRKTVRPIG